MHLTQVAFLALFIAALTAAFSRGGRPERIGGAVMLGAAVATPLLQTHMFLGLELGIAVLDLVLLGALGWLTFWSDRLWPVFASAFQTIGVLTHVARFIAGPVHGDVYGHLLVLWSYPVVLALLWGALVEARQDKSVTVTKPVSPDERTMQRESNALSRKPAASVANDHALLTRLLTLHGSGPESAAFATDLLSRTGNFAAAVATPAARLRSWGFDDRITEALAFARSTTRTSLKRKLETRLKLDNAKDTIDYLHTELAHLPHEQVRVLYLNARDRLILDEVHGEGSVNAASVYPREIIKRALDAGALKVILAHNHPSGDPCPSRDDIIMTKAIMEAGRHVGITVLDHFVIGTSGHFSMKQAGLI